MPFDITLPNDVQNLLKLADALEREHEGFKWNFDEVYTRHACGAVGCAIGMAIHIGLVNERDHDCEIRRQLGMTIDQIDSTFYSLPDEYGADPYDEAEITPAMVAAQLRRIASEKLSSRSLQEKTADV